MKLCPACKLEKALTEFGKSSSRKDGKQPYCKECQRSKVKAHYDANTQYYVNKARKRNLETMEVTREFVYQYLLVHPCVDCSQSDPLTLQFDHVQGEKVRSISQMVTWGLCIDKIKAEIDKCVVRCASCHQKKTAMQFGWWSALRQAE